MISMVLMITVAVILAITLGAARRLQRRQVQIQRENLAMQLELERHRQAAQLILRELQNP